jgi:signal transduction histidine kinase
MSSFGTKALPAPLRLPAREVIALAVAVLPVAGLLVEPRLDFVLPASIYVAIHSLLEILVVVVSVATFGVQWYAAEARAGDARGRLLGAAFLGVAILESIHLLSFPGMTAFGLGSTGRAIWYWLAARFMTVAALLLASAIAPARGGWLLRRWSLLAIVLALVAAAVLTEVLTPSAASLFFEERSGLTPLKKAFELLVVILAAAAGLQYLRLYRRSGDRAAWRISLALALTVLSELCFCLYASAYDAFNLLGHVYLAAAFYLIFDALFVSTLLRPYADLTVASAELSASNAELMRLRQLIQDELRVTIARLEETQRLQDDMLRAVTHDVRTPLQVIMLQGERLRRNASRDPGRAAACAQTILDNARRITAMMGDLVDAAQLERGLKLELRSVHIGDLIGNLLASSAGVLDTARVQLEVPSELPAVNADPNRLERILANLIGNALKYSEPGSPVCVAASAAASEVHIAISDRGSGIPPEDLPHIFERFYRGRSARGDGLGLGLHIARLLARAHGGDVLAESRVGVGSRFSVRLPLGDRDVGASLDAVMER